MFSGSYFFFPAMGIKKLQVPLGGNCAHEGG